MLPVLPALLAVPTGSARSAPPSASLEFQIDQDSEINRSLRRGDIAAQLVLRAGAAARLVFAFPAGDSGIGIWLHAHTGRPVHWRVLSAPQAIQAQDARGRPLRGLQVDVLADVPGLQIDQVLLSSIRVLRNYEAGNPLPPAIRVAAQRSGTRLLWSRDRLDGAPGYRLSLQALDGARIAGQSIQAAAGARFLHLRLQGFSGEVPLVPLRSGALLRATATPGLRERRILAFLSYREKFLAGAWRFDTYFGRDTLFTLMLLAPVLQPTAMADGIDSVLCRLSPQGEVAHEEAIGEYAILLNEAAGRGVHATPVYDYGMLDEDFLLAPLVARWLLEAPGERRAAAAFLAADDGCGERRVDALLRNLRYVVQRTQAFAREPQARWLIGLKRGQRAGDWRDSDNGLDGGHYPFDVNAVLVPAALLATQRLLDSALLRPYLAPGDALLLGAAGAQGRTWRDSAWPLFRVQIDRAAALARLRGYAASLHLDPGPAAAALSSGPLSFQALSLDDAGQPLPVMHSDVAFELLFDTPAPAMLGATLDTLMRPFPTGLMTPVGLLVANPAFAGTAAQDRFTRRDYHGTVVWAWQQAVLLAGMARQLQRSDLPPPLRARLLRAQTRLWKAVDRARALRGSELWSWSYAGAAAGPGSGGYRLQPFRAAGSGEAESDAAQLWSTVFLALRP